MILEFMRNDHRECDHYYSESENALLAGNFAQASEAFGHFAEATLHHFRMEEETLFPTFEQRTGMMGGPTQMMRYEHQQLRALIDSMHHALEAGKVNDFLGIGESMMIMLQQHNMKEEQMLYPMTERALGGDASLMVQSLKEMAR